MTQFIQNSEFLTMKLCVIHVIHIPTVIPEAKVLHLHLAENDRIINNNNIKNGYIVHIESSPFVSCYFLRLVIDFVQIAIIQVSFPFIYPKSASWPYVDMAHHWRV